MALTLSEAPSTLDEALEWYDRAGLRPILVHAPRGDGHQCTCGKKHEVSSAGSSACGKHPIAASWQKPTELAELRNQLARLNFVPNIGIVLGEQQHGEYILAIDVDDEVRMAELIAEIGELPDTVRGESGRGYRLLFELPREIETSKLKNITALTPGPVDREKKPGVDVKVRGGQVVVAPSRHVNGKQYVWTQLGTITLLPMPWALELTSAHIELPRFIGGFTPQSMKDDSKIKRKAEAYLQKAVMGDSQRIAACGPGLRNTLLHKRAVALFSLCMGLYLGWKWDYVHDELRRAATHAGLHKAEIERTLSSAEKFVREHADPRVPVGLAEPLTGTGISAPPPAPRPIDVDDVRLTIRMSVELHEDVDATVVALKADPNLYQREAVLVQIVRTTQEEATKDRNAIPAGTPQIRNVSLATLRERMTRYARFEKHTEKWGWSRAIPADHIVAATLERGQWKGIRPIVGVAETPFLRPDGSICQTPGYDVATSYEYMPAVPFTPVADRPTQKDAQEAYKTLRDVFYDFPFTLGPSVPIAAILTLLARPAIEGSTPCFAFDASTRGSGKSLQTDVIATIVTGRSMPRMTYPVREEEVEKILGAYALRGTPFFSFDNVGRDFGGSAIDRFITARDTVEIRILGKSVVPTLPWRSVMFANGNNLGYFADTASRILRTRIEPQEEHPELRSQFKHDLPTYARIQRLRLVHAALTILRAYTAAGSPDMGAPRWGRFEEWSRLVPHAVVFAGGEDPLDSRPKSDAEIDEIAAALSAFMTEFEKHFPDGCSAAELLIHISGTKPGDLLRESIRTLCDSKPGAVPESSEIGRAMRRSRGRVIDGRRIDGKPGQGGAMRWRVDSGD